MENNNRDIVVFGFYVVMVIDYGGRYCFFYRGYLLGLVLELWGVCIDVLLCILVCDFGLKLI